ncbi:MAG: hypothetical protein ACJ76S_08040 [Solirubrobacteraceae bacterium]
MEDGVPRREHFWAERDRRRSLASLPERRRQARFAAIAGLTAAIVLPVLLWHGVVAGIASEFRLDLHYLLTEWSPWLLIVAGLGFGVPVVWSTGRDPESRWYPRARNAYAGWGVTLYLLGVVLATQVAQIYHLHVH